MRRAPWTVFLAAGCGRRLGSVTGGVPKQFWSRGRMPTLLETTAARCAFFAPTPHRITVVSSQHRVHVGQLHHRHAFGRILFQPADRGTAVGVMLALDRILVVDPDPVVLLTPVDHGVGRPHLFRQGLDQAATAVAAGVHNIVLFGVEPTRPAQDYGWITPVPGIRAPDRIAPVRAFREKPGPAEAAQLMDAGAVWNTMVLLGRGRSVFDICAKAAPEAAALFAAARRRRPLERAAFLSRWYGSLPATDLSRDVLARSGGLSVYGWPSDLDWTDLGTPERMRAWSRRHAAGPRSSVQAPPVALTGVA
jgi:mannose-1-phosphate guanylyltransferase